MIRTDQNMTGRAPRSLRETRQGVWQIAAQKAPSVLTIIVLCLALGAGGFALLQRIAHANFTEATYGGK